MAVRGSACDTRRPCQFLDSRQPPAPVSQGSCRLLLSGRSVHCLSDEVGMTVMPAVLLDHVDQDPWQARRATVRPGAPRELPRSPFASASAIPGRSHIVPVQTLGEPVLFDVGQMFEHPAQGHRRRADRGPQAGCIQSEHFQAKVARWYSRKPSRVAVSSPPSGGSGRPCSSITVIGERIIPWSRRSF